jgi:hypothetical protein
MKARQLEFRAIPQFDSGRWKLRLEVVPVDPVNETTMGMDVDSAAQARVNETNWAHWFLLPIERGRRERQISCRTNREAPFWRAWRRRRLPNSKTPWQDYLPAETLFNNATMGHGIVLAVSLGAIPIIFALTQQS